MSQVHIVLLGDSIFDNAAYVPDELPVVEQLREVLPERSGATLLATDGVVTTKVSQQLAGMPPDATHLVVSVGGNDALCSQDILLQPPRDMARGLASLFLGFRERYAAMLDRVCGLGKPVAVCTVYDKLPGRTDVERMALALFNDAIIREAVRRGLPIVDLRHVCTKTEDYASMSPIEPSAIGGMKIVKVIRDMVFAHDFESKRTAMYA